MKWRSISASSKSAHCPENVTQLGSDQGLYEWQALCLLREELEMGVKLTPVPLRLVGNVHHHGQSRLQKAAGALLKAGCAV